ncbi:hypothetical protein QWI17_12210 [Gilvimarinus sp. SDUM040013]|uniref:Uncharacterized protein n=1 Tax=Gilvimarinus gilvus TaxID=3058038 RepID=A0ABU4RWC3_9GAMM|nr:hypothetical protein [Gilvimarinus sp. SDUM040013]MDO3386601.1 hypothetical protein [Gilvimarinus sp. SDUM040013]MDX6849177.1 hypothetical protein [Gilvimarinus sp. SDUM040013]
MKSILSLSVLIILEVFCTAYVYADDKPLEEVYVRGVYLPSGYYHYLTNHMRTPDAEMSFILSSIRRYGQANRTRAMLYGQWRNKCGSLVSSIKEKFSSCKDDAIEDRSSFYKNICAPINNWTFRGGGSAGYDEYLRFEGEFEVEFVSYDKCIHENEFNYDSNISDCKIQAQNSRNENMSMCLGSDINFWEYNYEGDYE